MTALALTPRLKRKTGGPKRPTPPWVWFLIAALNLGLGALSLHVDKPAHAACNLIIAFVCALWGKFGFNR